MTFVMSDAVVVNIIHGVVSLVGVIITAYVTYRIGKIDKRVDQYHKEVNGNMSKLLETTANLATATEKAKHKK